MCNFDALEFVAKYPKHKDMLSENTFNNSIIDIFII